MSIFYYANILLPLAGGIGIFLLGMKFLSDGLQTVAGSRLKALVGLATNNRLFGVGIGLLITGIIQSSSITTVLVVSFVDGGLMTLAQAVGVIMGANIGTTITGWILTIKIDHLGLPIAGIAAIVYIFSKKESVKYTALGTLGLGCVFMGLFFMKDAVAPIKDYPQFVAMFHPFQATSYLGVIKCAAVGCFLTLLIQSSSVTIGITMVLAIQGLIGFETAAALVLGENIGTTITAILASLGANNNARRAALFHAIFNLLGVFYITILFQPFIGFVKWELNAFFGLKNLESVENISFGIAAVHSTFNIFNTLMFLIPCRAVARLLESQTITKALTKIKFLRKEINASEIEELLRMIRSRNIDSSHVKYMEMESRVKKVLGYMGKQLETGVLSLGHCIENSKKDSPQIEQIFEMEKKCDKIKEKVLTVLTGFVGSEETSTPQIQQRIFTYERIFDHLESTSDYITQVAKLRLRLLDNKIDFLDYQKHDLLLLNNIILASLLKLLPLFENTLQRGNIKLADEYDKNFAEIKDMIRAMRTTFWSVSSGNVTDHILDDAYSNMISSYRKICDHLRGANNAIFGVDRD